MSMRKYDTTVNDLRVLVIEDEALVRVTLVDSLRFLGVKVVASASNAVSALQAGRDFFPDAIICDIDLGSGPHGIDIAHSLRSVNPNLGIVFLSTLADPRLKNTGARGLPSGAIYLKKADVIRNKNLLDSLSSSISTEAKHQNQSFDRIQLTENQIQTLQQVASGLTNTEIARLRGITVSSVENAIGRLAKKLKLKDTPEGNQRVLITRYYFTLLGKMPHGL